MSLQVVRAVGLVTVQDYGRPGHMHEGLPPGGALVPDLLARANRRVGNADDAAAIEIMGALTVIARGPATIATDRDGRRDLSAGDQITVASGDCRVTYLAVPGGIDAPVVLGSRSTHLSAGIGALIKKGDVVDGVTYGGPTFRLRQGYGGPPKPRAKVVRLDDDPGEPEGSPSEEGSGPTVATITVVPGPDFDAFDAGAIDHLMSVDWIVRPESSRVGTRLGGGVIGRGQGADATRPMVSGAIEVPPDGQPVVLGPEHPTTGGYPVIAVIAHADLGRFFSTPVGKVVRFQM